MILNRISRPFFILLACLALVAPASTAVEAGLLGKIAHVAGDAATGAGKHLDDVLPGTKEALWLTKKLPHGNGTGKIALLPGSEGSWRLVTATGEEIHLSSLDEIAAKIDDVSTSSTRPLAGDTLPAKAAKKAQTYAVAVREQDFFKLRDQASALPGKVDLQLVRDSGRSYPLKPIPHKNSSRLAVELNGTTLLNPVSARALDANIKFLDRPVNKANLKIARFDSAAGKTPGSVVNPDDLISTLDPDLLESSLAKFKNRTLLVSGKFVSDPQSGAIKLIVKDGKKTRQIDAAALEKAAARQRVNLVTIQSQSVVQPGKTWFSKTGIEKRFAATKDSVTQADLVKALAPKGFKTVINAGEAPGDVRLLMTSRYLPVDPAALKPAAAGADYSPGSWLLDGAYSGGVRFVRANVEDPDHTNEVESRWLPWVSNMALIGGAVLIIGYAVVSFKTWKWWSAIWRVIGRKTAGTEQFSKPVRILKLVTFIPFSIVMFVPGALWLYVGETLGWITWPFRKLFGSRKTA